MTFIVCHFEINQFNTMDLTFKILVALFITLILVIIVIGYILFKISKNFIYYLNKVIHEKTNNQKSNYYMAAFYDEIYDFLSELEYRNEIRLSDEAKQLLILPLIEYQKITRRGHDLSPQRNFGKELDNWRKSVSKIIETIAFEPASIDRANKGSIQNERTSLSVIKAYANRFCNIPPFCGEK